MNRDLFNVEQDSEEGPKDKSEWAYLRGLEEIELQRFVAEQDAEVIAGQ